MRFAFALFMLLAAAAFSALGVWQLARLTWKQDLITQTTHKLAQPPAEAPTPEAWPSIGPQNAYTRVRASGHYLPNKNVFVLASTRLGRGYWVLTPFVTSAGHTLVVNRGFTPSSQRDALPTTPETSTTITGLLRLTEPKGSLLQSNNPAQNLWYSRDVAAIATALHIANAAPYFIDADETPDDMPTGGLTVINFPNNHLQYALTWFALAILSLVGLGLILTRRA